MKNKPPDCLPRLEAILRDMESVIVACSGGVDSTLLAVAAQRVLGSRALAVTAVSPALAARDLADAEAIAAQFNLNHRIINTDELQREGYVANSPQRCYFCKTELYDQLVTLADAEGYAWIANGANTDDLGDYRPGMTAASEHNIRSPMVEARMDKSQVRDAARWLGVPLWDKPAQPCLSSRIPYGTPVTVESLQRIEAAEDILRDLGLREVRARHHDKLCRIEVAADQMELAFAHRDQITARLKSLGYLWVSLDLNPLRSGSLNDVLLPNQNAMESGETMPKTDPDTLRKIQAAFEKYKEACEASKLQPRAVDTYTRYVDMFIRWLDDRFEPGGTLR